LVKNQTISRFLLLKASLTQENVQNPIMNEELKEETPAIALEESV
jgi:hypothetical protein